jgi:hypothetical protein
MVQMFSSKLQALELERTRSSPSTDLFKLLGSGFLRAPPRLFAVAGEPLRITHFDPISNFLCPHLPHSLSVGKNRGGFLAWIDCSNPYAIFSSVGSLHARPKKEIPTGKPKTNPAGTVISG